MVRSYFEVNRCVAIKALVDTKAALLYDCYHPSNHVQAPNMSPGMDDVFVEMDLYKFLYVSIPANTYVK